MKESITSVDIIDRYRNLRDPRRRYTSYLSEQKVKDQRSQEKILLRQHLSKDCPIDEIRSRLINIDSAKLGDIVKSEFYNPDVMKITSCINQAVVNGVYYDVSNNPDIMRSVQEWFSSPRKIGDDSADGIVFKSDVRDGDNMVVLKSPREISVHSNDQFAHELFIGKMGLNKARHDIPNFVYTFGGFKCEGSGVNEGGDGILCGGISGKPVQYIIYENIEPAISVKSYLDTCGPGGYLSLMMQIIFTTYYGYLKFDWTHYDLHTNNVLMREVKTQKPKFCIKYPIDGKDYYVRSTHVATIIDYGRSHIKVNGCHYGYCLERGEIYPDKSFPIFDIYKFLMLTARYLHYCDTPSSLRCFEVAKKIFSFFNTEESLNQAIERQYETRYQFPGLEYVKSLFTVPDLIRHIRKKIPKLFWHVVKITKKNARFPVLNCSDMSCQNLNELYTTTGVSGPRFESVDETGPETGFGCDAAASSSSSTSIASPRTPKGPTSPRIPNTPKTPNTAKLFQINSLSDYHLQKEILTKQSNSFDQLKDCYSIEDYYVHVHHHFLKCEKFIHSFEQLAEKIILAEDTYFNCEVVSEIKDTQLFGTEWTNYLIYTFNDVILLNQLCDAIHRNLEVGLGTTFDFNDTEVHSKLKNIFDHEHVTEITYDRVRNARILAKELYPYAQMVQKRHLPQQIQTNITKLLGTLDLLI